MLLKSGRGVSPLITYTGRLHPKGVPFQVSKSKRVGISLVERYGNLLVWSVKGPNTANIHTHFRALKKSRQRPSFVVNSCLTDSVFKAIKRNAKLQTIST